MKAHPEYCHLKRVCFKDGELTTLWETVQAAKIAQDMASLLNKNNAKNYIELDVMPRLDRNLRPIRLTVQWSDGLSPAAKAAQLEAWREDAINLYPELEKLALT